VQVLTTTLTTTASGKPPLRPAQADSPALPSSAAADYRRATERSVRFWEQNGSGQRMAGAVRYSQLPRTDVADVHRRAGTAAL
jgi:hypothetical protein